MFHHKVVVVVRQSKLKMQDCEVEDIEIGRAFSNTLIF